MMKNSKNDAIERLKEFIKAKNVPVARFERNCGLSNGYVSTTRSSIGSDKVFSIWCAYPDLNIMWLITGEGEMLNATNTLHNESGVLINGDNNNSPIDNRHFTSDSPDVLKMQIEAMECTIDAKDYTIKEQDARIKEQDARITMLLEQIRQQQEQIGLLITK